MSEPLSERLRAYAKDQGGWHNIDDTCEEAANLINALVAALDRWEAAYQTGRHEPLVIAREAATAVLARAKGEPK